MKYREMQKQKGVMNEMKMTKLQWPVSAWYCCYNRPQTFC